MQEPNTETHALGTSVSISARWLIPTLFSPSPRPSPLVRGRIVGRCWLKPGALERSRRGRRRSLSPREMVRVKGKGSTENPAF